MLLLNPRGDQKSVLWGQMLRSHRDLQKSKHADLQISFLCIIEEVQQRSLFNLEILNAFLIEPIY